MAQPNVRIRKKYLGNLVDHFSGFIIIVIINVSTILFAPLESLLLSTHDTRTINIFYSFFIFKRNLTSD